MHTFHLDIRVPSLELLREICAPKHGPCFIKSLQPAHAMQPLGLITFGVILKVAGIGFQHFQAFFSSYTFDGSVLEIFIS